jgi:uncharacterized protein (DUF885 family)
MKKIVLFLSLYLIHTGTFAQPSPKAAQQLTALYEAYNEDFLRLNPTAASARGDNRYNDRLGISISEEHRESERKMYATYLQRAKKIGSSGLSGQDLLSYQVFVYLMEQNRKALDFDLHLLPLNQMGSLPAYFAQMGAGASVHPFKSVKDYEDFLKRMADFERWTQTAISNMRKGMATGIVQPRVVMEKVLPQLEAMIVTDPQQSMFYTPVTKMPENFSATDKTRLTDAYRQAIMQQVVPAYRALHTFVADEYLPKTRTSVGISQIPNGKALYPFLVRSFTTTELTPDQIFDIGMNEVKRIRSEMEQVKAQVGFEGDLAAFFKFLDTDPQFYPFNSEEEVLQAYRDIHTRMLPQLSQTFNLVPKAGFEIRAVEKFRAATSAHHYMRPSADGSRPGVFYVPIPDVTKYYSYQMEDMFLHEAIPGHHYQIALQQEQAGLPKFRQFGSFGAYTEGWGLYSESLGKELGLYQDPYQYLGRLGADMHRALRLVLDVGIHHKGWTREQAIAFSLENEPTSEQRVIAEVERYIANPGQALSYKIGELKLLEIRANAEKALGDKFDIRAFHDQILQDGAMPLSILESKMNEWVRQERAKQTGSRSSE